MQSASTGSIRSEATLYTGVSDAAREPLLRTAAVAVSDIVSKVCLEGGRGSAEIIFEASAQGEHLPLVTQEEFKQDLCRELARLDRWALERQWRIHPADAVLNLIVVVSDRFKISKSLVPAWMGHLGRMEFPSWRVAKRKAAITHELVHVLFPNGNRLLAEGLAVYLQAEIGGNAAFPNFGEPLHDLAQRQLQDMVPAFCNAEPATLAQIDVSELDAIPTPRPLTFMVGGEFHGEDPRGQARLYPLAGSFVQFLIETRGIELFCELYGRTPLIIEQHNVGSADRWRQVYGCSPDELMNEWKRLIATTHRVDQS
jgi:hypothetical protein